MSNQEIETVIVQVLEDVQKTSGRKWNGLNADQKPIGDLDGFDSLSGIETTVMIEERFECNLGAESVFVSESGKRALMVGQIVERVAKILASKGGKE